MLMQWKTTSDPLFNDVRVLTRQLDEMFGDRRPKARATRRDVTVSESEEAFILRATLPGMSPEDLSLEVVDGTLKLGASRSSDAPEGYRALRRERHPLSLQRAFTLGPKVDADAIEAAFEDGILTITLPKRAEQQPRRIAVRAA